MTATALPSRAGFTKAEALAHTERLNASIDETLDLIFEAWVGSIWTGLDDVDSWDAYVDTYAPRIKTLRLPVVDRRKVLQTWAAAGMPQRAAAKGLNVSVGTVASDAKVLTLPEGSKSRSGDGRLRPQRTATVTPLPVEPPAGLSQVDRAIFYVEQAGTRGLTVKDLIRKAGWHHGIASAALSRAHNKRGAIGPFGPYRDGCNAYVLTEVPR